MRVIAKAKAGDKVAVLSPSFAAPGVFPRVHEQALDRLQRATGLTPVEYPTTRRVGAAPRDRAADLRRALLDPEIRAVLATIGGTDQVTVISHLKEDVAAAIARDPKPFLGYSDNTHLLNWLWRRGIPGYYGGSTQVHLGSGPGLDAVHEVSLRAALLEGGELEVTDPEESEDYGVSWDDPRSLVEFGIRERTEPWSWVGPSRSVAGRTWGGCIDTFPALFIAGREPRDFSPLADGILLVEAAENLMPADTFGDILRALGERGILELVGCVIIARPPATALFARNDTPADDHRRYQRDTAFEVIERYNSQAVAVFGPPFGHTRPQWILPYGGSMRVDSHARKIYADYTLTTF